MTLEYIKEVLRRGGLNELSGLLCDVTTKKGELRGEQIKLYIDTYNILPNEYVILDDDVFDMREDQMPRVINTSTQTGLTEKDCQRAFSLLTC